MLSRGYNNMYNQYTFAIHKGTQLVGFTYYATTKPSGAINSQSKFWRCHYSEGKSRIFMGDSQKTFLSQWIMLHIKHICFISFDFFT